MSQNGNGGTHLADVMPEALVNQAKRARTNHGSKVSAMSRRIAHLLKKKVEPTDGWLKFLESFMEVAKLATDQTHHRMMSSLREICLKLILPQVRDGKLADAVAVLKAVEKLPLPLPDNGTASARDQAADLRRRLTAKAEYPRVERLSPAQLIDLIDEVMEIEPEGTICFQIDNLEIERQPLKPWFRDGNPSNDAEGNVLWQFRLKVSSHGRKPYVVWAVNEDGTFFLLAGENNVSIQLNGRDQTINRRSLELVSIMMMQKLVKADEEQTKTAAPTALIVPTTAVTATIKPSNNRKPSKPSFSNMFEKLATRIDSPSKLTVNLEGVTVSRQIVEERNGITQFRLRFESAKGFTVIAVNAKGSIHVFPNGKAFDRLNGQLAWEWVNHALMAFWELLHK